MCSTYATPPGCRSPGGWVGLTTSETSLASVRSRASFSPSRSSSYAYTSDRQSQWSTPRRQSRSRWATRVFVAALYITLPFSIWHEINLFLFNIMRVSRLRLSIFPARQHCRCPMSNRLSVSCKWSMLVCKPKPTMLRLTSALPEVRVAGHAI